MTVIPKQDTQTQESSTVKLAEYAKAIQVCECAFWGVRNSPDCSDSTGCRDIWLKRQRDEIAYYLAEAQEEIERELSYFIGQKWVTDERHGYTRPVQTKWGYVISGGVRAETDIEASSIVDYSTEPATLGPIATTVTDEDEIKVFHAGTDIEIDPSSITISGGNVTIEIPRCRLVDPDYAENPSNGWNYTDLGKFAVTVDVKRVYNDTTTQALLVRPNSCNTNCTDEQTSACMYIRRSKIGSVDVPNSACGLCGCCAEFVDLNYYSGKDMTKQARDTIIRLAHTKMPRNPCSCSPSDEFWKKDRIIPDTITRERLNNPYGLMEGAWIAWRWTQAQALKRGGTL